ncbi:MAG: restriction endonuclease subunit S, partial [Oscillospiraceae bacterium]
IGEYAFDCEALLLAGNNSTANYDVKYYNGKFNAYQRTYVITTKTQSIVYLYLKVIMKSKLSELKNQSIGSQTKYLTLGVIQNLDIPLPPLEIQHQIVKNINEEMAIVEQNKRLIEIFEQKIKDKINEVWGK